MAASYPSSLINFGLPKQNLTDIIQASDPNSLRDEVLAIETAVGITPSLSTSATAGGWYNDGRDYGTVSARLANIEAGIVSDTHTQYVKNAGGSTITPSAISTVGITVAANPIGQTADLQQWKNSSGSKVTYVDSTGTLYSNNGPVGSYVPHFLLGGM